MAELEKKSMMERKKRDIAKRKQSRDDHHKQSLREKISFVQTINQITEIEDEVLSLAQADKELSTSTIGAYNTVINSKWKKINKLLPDLKAVEVEVSKREKSAEDILDDELARIAVDDN